MSSKKRIAVIAGDGIGKETMPEGLRVVDAAARKFGIDLAFDHFDFSSWDYFEKHGKMLPDDWKDQIGGHDAIFFGAVGWPEKIADHVSLWGSLLLFRREFDQYINLRPARLMPGITAPVVRRDGSPREPGEIDMYIVRENTEGEYSSIGGRMYAGTPRDLLDGVERDGLLVKLPHRPQDLHETIGAQHLDVGRLRQIGHQHVGEAGPQPVHLLLAGVVLEVQHRN